MKVSYYNADGYYEPLRYSKMKRRPRLSSPIMIRTHIFQFLAERHSISWNM